MIPVKLLDGRQLEVVSSTTCAELAERLGEAGALAAKIDGKLCDLSTPISEECALSFINFGDDAGKKVLRHTASHILAQAVKRLYPEVKLTIGPAIENGFYYDFDRETPFTPEDLGRIEQEMRKIVAEAYPVERFTLKRDQAVRLMEERGEPYKMQLIKELPEDEILSFYRQGEFVDLCAGPHVPNTSLVNAIKLLSCAGSYWKGDAKNKMLQRVYGTAFTNSEDLSKYLNLLEEAKKRDHRKLGRELELFELFEEGPGFPFFLPKGVILRNTLIDFWREEHKKRRYKEISTPVILNEALWHRSGHWDHYRENMYFTKIDDSNFVIKPMNCPGGMLVYASKPHSYRDLPERVAELGLVHRHELSGTLHGLMRVRCFTQDDAHIFMTQDQVESEILGVMELIDRFYSVFGFPYTLELSTRPENSIGSDEDWQLATNALIHALEKAGKAYTVNEGDGAFYGPKIDFHLTDSIGRTWQCGTIQLDFQMPERFELTYSGADGEKHRPVMLHRVVFGSIERFIAILTEHYAGAFPLWLSPVQIRVLPISDKNRPYAEKISALLEDAGLRCETDDRNEKIGYRIREGVLQKIPYLLVIGDKEASEGTVAVRDRRSGKTEEMSPSAFLEKAKTEVLHKL